MFKRKSRSLSRDKEEGNVLRKSLLSLTSNNEDDIQLLGQEQIQPPVMDNSGNNNYNNNNGLHPDMRSWDDNRAGHALFFTLRACAFALLGGALRAGAFALFFGP